MPVWQLLDEGFQGNDLVLKHKQKCQQEALIDTVPARGREGSRTEEAVVDNTDMTRIWKYHMR
jgi:predicted SPOUT superfamily RNA methylase MTH1